MSKELSSRSRFVNFGFAACRHLRCHPAITGVFLVLLILFVWGQVNGDVTDNKTPLLVKVTKGNIENTVAAAGTLAPSESVEVGAQVSGQLEKLFVDVGEIVKSNQQLASIDASVQAQKVEASRASLSALEVQLKGRQAALDLAEANLNRQKNMFKDRATSQQEVDEAINTLMAAQSNLAQLQAQISQSKASLASDEAELGYSKIYSPRDGTIVSIAVEEGQTLNTNQVAPTVMTVADLSVMTVETDVSEADVGKLKPGMSVYFTTLGNGKRRWYGKLRQILPTPKVTNNVVLYTALFDVENSDGTLLSGMTAQVFFITSSAVDVLTVPVASLFNIRPIDNLLTDDRTAIDKKNHSERHDRLPVKTEENPPISVRIRPSREQENNPGALAGERHSRFQRRQLEKGNPPENTPQKMASIKVVDENGEIVVRDIVIGVTSRVVAEVVSGLAIGESVVAGVSEQKQAYRGNNESGRKERRPMMGGFR